MEMSPKHSRPYWHVDLKWVFGLLLSVVLAVWLFVLVAYRVTAPDVGIPLSTNILVMQFSRDGVDSTAGVEELRAKIAASPTKSIQPIPGFPAVVVTEEDLKLSPRQLREKIFRQIIEPLYYKGVKQFAAEQTSDPAAQKKFENDASLLGFITQERHGQIGAIAMWLAVAVMSLLAGLVYFSHRFGRLVSPAVVLMLISIPGLVVFTILRIWTSQPTGTPRQAEDYAALIASSKGAFVPLATAGQQVYLWAIYVALFLLAAAVVGRIIVAIMGKKPKSHPEKT